MLFTCGEVFGAFAFALRGGVERLRLAFSGEGWLYTRFDVSSWTGTLNDDDVNIRSYLSFTP